MSRTTSPPVAETDQLAAGGSVTWMRAALVAAAALGAGLYLARQLDRQTGQTFSGRLQARMHTVTVERAARIKQIAVKPGQRIAAGETLLVLETRPEEGTLEERRQDAARKQQELVRVKAAADLEIHWRRRELQAEIFQTQLKLAGLRQEKLHLEVEQLAWHEQLSLKEVFSDAESPSPVLGLISHRAAAATEGRVAAMLREDAAAAKAQALASQIALCQQRLEELKSLDQGLDERIRTSHGVSFAEEQYQRAVERLSDGEAETIDATVVSPGYGVIGLFRKQPGEAVEPGEVMVQILDDDRRTIEVDVPSRSVVRFTPGLAVRLDFPGPESRTGVVSSISPQASATTVPVDDRDDDALVKLVIEPSGKLWPNVPIGSRVVVYEP